jgi:predicted metal-dependent phosphotriesterase family hydrolase
MNSEALRLPFKGQVMAVSGPVSPSSLGVVDAHNHLWIEALDDVSPDSPHLTEYDPILSELKEYVQAGGTAIVDCQPGGCGRNGNKLLQLSGESGVTVIAATGFHRRTYYSPGWWLWEASSQEIAGYFMDEVQNGLKESLQQPETVKAGLIKCACESTLRETPQAPLEAAAWAAAELGLCVEVHTERGADAEAILDYFVAHGVQAGQIVLCHMDKAPDLGLHRSLAEAGACLEYDTFYRPKYAPDTKVWPLIQKMVLNGFDHNVALATDMAEASMWKHIGGGPGLIGLMNQIRPCLEKMGLGLPAIKNLMGGNITRRLTGMA